MDFRKLFAQRKRLKRLFIIFAVIFGLLTMLYLGKNSGGDINIIWVPCLILMIICIAGIITLEMMQQDMKETGRTGQKMRDCLYAALRTHFDTGDAKMNVGLSLTIMDYYLSPETMDEIMGLARRATTKEEDVLAACGDQILKLMIEKFEAGPEGSGRELLSPAERAMYDKLRRAVTGTLHKSAGF